MHDRAVIDADLCSRLLLLLLQQDLMRFIQFSVCWLSVRQVLASNRGALLACLATLHVLRGARLGRWLVVSQQTIMSRVWP